MLKYCIKYATRSRPEFFKKAIENIQSTIHTKDYLILVSADEDDPTMNNPEIIGYCVARENIKLVFGHSKSKIQAINADMEHAGEWDILLNMSDDFYFPNAGWDRLIEERVKSTWGDSLDWVAHFDDGYCRDALPTMSIMGRDYYLRDKYIYYPEYKSFSCDAEFMYVAMTRGRHKYFPDIIALHQHPANTKIGKDELYRVNSLHTPHDTELYWKRLHADFGMVEEGYSEPFEWSKFKKQ